MNSVGVNMSRAIGPALGGVITASFGIAAPFWVNAVSNLGTIGALTRWRPPTRRNSQLPAERFASAMRTGIRHARSNNHLRATLTGISWIAVLANLNVSAQLALPEWVRGRGLAIYVMVFFGAMTIGSVIWGQIARLGGLPLAHFIAATGATLAVAATWRWRLQTGSGPDLTPSMDWPTGFCRLRRQTGLRFTIQENAIADIEVDINYSLN